MRTKSTGAVSIIGGADGPTSVFIAGRSQKQPLKIRIRQAIYRHKPEVLGKMQDNIIPMDFHLYRMQVGDGMFEMGIDYKWDILGISYSGDKKEMKLCEKISKELYRYYGVEESDIKNKTKRYSALVTALSS